MTEHNHSSEPRRLYSRPANRSLEAYKVWVAAVVLALNPAAAANDQGKLSETEWEAQWRNFWAADGGTHG